MGYMLRSFVGICICAPCMLSAQVDSIRLKYGNTITQEDLRKHLEVLASDAYEGRETGAQGQKMAASYIREQFVSYGIPPVPDAEEKGLINGYEQPFPLELTRPGGLSLIVNGTPIGFMQEFFYLSERLREDYSTDKVVFAGMGDQDPGPDARGGTVLVLDKGSGTTATDRPSRELFQRITRLAAMAEQAGARVLLIASPTGCWSCRSAGNPGSGACVRPAAARWPSCLPPA